MRNDNFAVFDIETKWHEGIDISIDFEVLGFFDGQRFKTFDSVRSFLLWVDRTAYDGWTIFAHNLGKFDGLFLIEEIFRMDWSVEIVPRQGKILLIKIVGKNSTLTFSDSLALMPDKLEKILEGFGVQTKKGKIDYRQISKDDPETLAYLESDCVGLHQALCAFRSSEWVDRLQLTIASQALDTYKRKFMYMVPECLNYADEELIRERFYVGGRVEVFKGMGTNVSAFDVNSLYPFSMLGEMPCGGFRRTNVFEGERIGFYTVRVLKCPSFYISPFYQRMNGTLYFVNGPGVFNLSSRTLNYLVKEFGITFEVLSGFVFDNTTHLFDEWVSVFYQKKREAKGSGQYLIAKYFLNAFYGKLGQRREHDNVVSYSEDLGEDFVPDERLDNYGLVRVHNVSESKFILPYIAAWITDTARFYHWQYLMRSANSVFYCDTDSIYTSKPSLYKSDVSKDIGKLTNEGKFKGVFLAPKCYALKSETEEHVHFKGFDTKGFTYDQFMHAQQTREDLIEQRQHIMGYGECLQYNNSVLHGRKTRRKIILNVGQFLKVSLVKKTAKIDYTKRLTIPSKKYIFDSQPFNQSQLREE